MSKYCPDIRCDFWEENPKGTKSERANFCSCCTKPLISNNPKFKKNIHEPDNIGDLPGASDDQIESKILIPQQISSTSLSYIKSEPKADEDRSNAETSKQNPDRSQASCEGDIIVDLTVETEFEVVIQEGETTTKSENKRKRSDSHLSETDHESKKPKKSIHKSNTQHKNLCSYSDISDSSAESDTDTQAGTTDNTTKSKSNPTTIPDTPRQASIPNKDTQNVDNIVPRRSIRLDSKVSSHLSNDTASGFSEPDTPCVKIQFNTLIMKDVYSNISSVNLRIFAKGRKYFQSNILMEKVEDVVVVSGEFVTLCGTLNFPVNCIWNDSIQFPYKYYIVHDDTETYEDLYHPYYAKIFMNRHFNIQNYALDNNNNYKQFDMMILPGITGNPNSTFFGLLKKTISSIIRYPGSVDKHATFKDIQERRLCSLQVLLPSCFDSINCKDIHSLEAYIEQFYYLVNNLIDCEFQSREKSSYDTFRDVAVNSWELYSNSSHGCPTNKLVTDWLISTCNGNIDSDPKSKVYIFYLACYFIHQYGLSNEDLNFKLIDLILGPIETILTDKCYEFDNLIALPIKISVSEFLFSKVMGGKHHKQLLRLLPIYHCMNDLSEHPPQFHDSVYEDMEYWGFPSDTEFTYRDAFAITEITPALNLIKYDPILPYSILIYSLHHTNVKKLYEYYLINLKQFPLSVFMNVLLLRYKQNNNCVILRTEVFKCLISTFKDNSKHLEVDDVNNLNLLTLTFVLKVPLQIVNERFYLCLELLSQGLMYCDSKSCDSLILSKKFKSFFNDFVIKWYSKNIKKKKMVYKDFQNEIEFWQHFITDYPFPKSTSILTLVEEFLLGRYKDTNVSQQYIIDLFLQLHKDSSYSFLLKEIFLKELTNRLQIFAPEEKSKFISRLSNQLSDPGQLVQMIDIFTKILLDEKRKFEDNPMNHVLSWSSWKIYFELFISDNKNKIISEDAQEMLDRALEKYSTFCERLQNFDVTLSEVEMIRDKKDYFLSFAGNFVLTNMLHVENSFTACLTMNIWIREQRSSLKLLHNLIENLHSIIDDETIPSFLLIISSDNKSIKDICNKKGELISFNPEYSEINEIIDFPEFKSICELSQSLISSKTILKVVKMVIEERKITQIRFDIKQFYQEIWVPVWNSCVQILKKFSEESILISDMCLYFNSCLSIEEITRELVLLKSGCSVYLKKPNRNNTDCFITCADKIHRYFQLQQCSEAAACIYELKDALLINEKYEIIQNLRNLSATFNNRQLSQVDAKVSGIANKLSQLLNIDVIQVFINKILFVNWIRDNLKDLNEVKTFVDISLTTCGGNPVDIDRITCLSSVCTNFAPLIFRIKPDTDYNDLIARCKEVIENVEKNKGLTKLLRQVGNSISFWKEMKKSHGSVEETTLMQLHSIMNFGVFHLEVKESLSLSEIVSLRIKKAEGEDKIYKLEQLNEFRNKIMLVVSKSFHSGEHTNSYEKSQLFTQKLDLIIEIAKIVIELIETGNRNFHKYEIKSIVNDIECVQSLIKEKSDLSKILECWKQKLEEARDKYYFLNYYTISQIVSLQNGITSFTTGKEDLELEQLYHLLRLINREVTREDIHRALELTGNAPKHQLNKQSIAQTPCFSTQSLSAAITQYPLIHQTLSNTVSKIVFNQTHNELFDFPDTFSQTEIEMAQSVSTKSDISLSLTIRGIIELNTTHASVVSEESLLHWCLSNETHDDISTNLEPEAEHLPFTSPCIQSSSDVGCIDLYLLGRILESIHNSSDSKLRAKRELPYSMKSDTINLIVLPSEDVLNFVLSLYCGENERLPLPFYHEVLVCTTETKLEELEIFWRRAMLFAHKSNFYLFCLIGIENLHYEVAVRAVSKFKQIQEVTKSTETSSGYKLVLVCAEEKEESSYMAAAFENCKLPTTMNKIQQDDMRPFVERKLSYVSPYTTSRCKYACEVDRDRYRVRLVVSDGVGAGKSRYINNLKSDLLLQGVVIDEEMEEAAITVSIHGKVAYEEDITDQLLRSRMGVKGHGVMFHVDIASTVHLGLELLLFKLIILGGVCKRSGEFWHCRSTDYYIIEMTLASDDRKYENYPKIQCRQPFDIIDPTIKSNSRGDMDLEELREEKYRRVNHYLKCLERKHLSDFTFHPAASGHEIDLVDILRRFVFHCGVKRPSWSEIRNFVTFLDKQLSDCDNSDYCKSSTVAEEWKGFKQFVVKFMILMSRDFATPSLRQTYIRDSGDNEVDALARFQIRKRRRWENSSHPYIFFHPDGHTMTFLGFHVSNEGDLLDSDDPSIVIEKQVMHPELFQILTANRVNLRENIHKLDKMEKIMKIAGVMDIEWVSDPDHEYVLTLDNMRKILAILMRFRCNIPVVIMGETGCGKTRLIQFMCSLQAMPIGAQNMLILKVHGGTTEKDVIHKVEEAEKLAIRNYEQHKIDTILFFDEANTSQAIGLIKEIMCDRRMYGRRIRSDVKLQFIAACNPYRRHSEEMLNKLSTAGLGFFTKARDTFDRLGDIPLRELVYRVMELPASMRPFVWDFGQLSDKIEMSYTREIVLKHVKSSSIEFPEGSLEVLVEVLAGAQYYMRSRKDECSFVSLRDVERAMRVLIWFYSKIEYFRPEDAESIYLHPNSEERVLEPGLISIDPNVDEGNINNIGYITYSLIISLAVCYRARLEERTKFDEYIVQFFKRPLTEINKGQIYYEVDRCHSLILNQMHIGANIAKNTALKENVFMMFVCIELKIPLFVIGKQGSSKSLAKSIISNSMQGSRSPDGSILQKFKQVQIMSFQCSQLSTAEGIIEVFKSCRNLQLKTGGNKFVACVVLDEVGLAEDSPLLPLKVLHPLLEDNSYGSDELKNEPSDFDNMETEMSLLREETDPDRDQDDEMKERVAFIGISNWSLDPAKMNRGIMLSRGDPDLCELEESAKGICKTNTSGTITNSIEKRIPHLAKAYLDLTNKKVSFGREYFGLRDFYCLIKMLVFLCNEFNTTLNRTILYHVVKRNFGGISDIDPFEVFEKFIKLPKEEDEKGPDSSPLGLIRANLETLSRSFHGETRYLLLLTENYAALNILVRSPDMWTNQLSFANIRVIFGSSFPCDQEYSAVCCNINRIKDCMETGKTIILLNLENLYESLYDALNQYYMEMSNQRYVDLGLGTQRMKCRVHDEFKLIVVADTETVQERFPTPLINRFEKHFLTMSTVLSEEGTDLSKQLSIWAKNFATLDKNISIGFRKRGYFSEGDCFIGYHNDTPSSIVFHVIKEMYPDLQDKSDSIDKSAVLERSQTTLLKMATTDAVLRVKNSQLAVLSQQITSVYFNLQLGSLGEYLRHVLEGICGSSTGAHLTLATTHSRLLTERDVDQLEQYLSAETSISLSNLSLQQFQTEQQFSREIQEFLRKDTGLNKKILLVQCERGADNAKLIACARHKTVDELKDWREEKTESNCEVCLVFLIQLCREAHGSKFVSFCGGDWNTVHIDNIRSLDYTELPPISYLIGKQIYDLFGGYQMETDSQSYQISEGRKLRDCIQPAASLLEDCSGSEGPIIFRIKNVLLLIEQNNYDFVNSFSERLRDLLQEQHISDETEFHWLHQTANCGGDIQSSGTFHKAVNLKINKAITPLLAELLALLDRNGNLELALPNEAVPTCLVNLWHEIFRDPLLLVLKYKDIVSPVTMCPRVRVPVLNDGAGGKYFKAHFPFSWLINQISSQLLIESKRNNSTGNNPDRDWRSYESLFYETPLAKKLSNCLFNNQQDLVLLYLRDFVHLKLYGRDIYQHEVYTFVILNCIRNYTTRSSGIEDGGMSYEEENISIPRIHCAYEDSKQLIDLLKQAFSFGGILASNLSTTLNELKPKEDKKLKCLELILLEEIIKLCPYKKELTSSQLLADKYVSEIKQWQSVMDRGLEFKQSDEFTEEYKVKIRCKWNRILAVQLFISYCSLEEFTLTELSIHVNRLYMILGESPDFTTAEVINHLLTVLSNCLKRISRKGSELKKTFKIRATRFFISVLTNLTFKYLRVGDRNLDLIKLLMSFVTLDEKSISELLTDKGSINIFSTAGLDPSPAFRTFLLQLLIKHRQDVFKEQISVFLTDIILNYSHDSLKRDLFLIIIQSIEDSLHQQFRQETNKLEYFNIQINRVTNGYLVSDNSLSYELLEKIATLRFLCVHISHCIIETYQFSTLTNSTQLPNNMRLIYMFKDICLMEGNEYLHTFLLKNLYHQLGSDTLHIITNCIDCRWIIPEHVMDEISQSQDIIPDYFIIYEEDYLRITSAVEQVNLLQNKNALTQFFNSDIKPDSKQTECLIYSLFQEVIKFLKKHPTSDPQSLDEALRTLKIFMRSAPLNLNLEMSDLIFQIATNEFGGGHLPNLQIKPTSSNHELFLIRLIFHGAVMLSSGTYHKLFLPISGIYSNPASLRKRLFPTMMDDQFVHTKSSIAESGKWYKCPNGHPYFIGDCGRPVVSDKCPDCGSRVGGVDYISDAFNSPLDMNRDETKPGYLLRRVNNSKDVSSGERSLDPATVKIIRILMGISFIWSSCSKYSIDTNSQDLLYLVKTVETRTDLPEFFYQHLERDLQDLARHTGQNFEEAVFLIHIVIKSLMETAKNNCGIPTILKTREVRDQWERAFSKKFIQPVLCSIHTDVRTQMEQVLNEKRIVNNPLLRVVYEREEPEPDNPLPYLWRYRTIVSLEHFSQSFSSADSCPLTDKFLKEENKLSVTRYLPDIVQLQKRVRDRLLHRIDKREATRVTIKEFLAKVRLSETKQESEGLSRLIESLATAWDLIGEEVRNNGRLRMDDSLNKQEITPATSLAYLLPYSTGEGVLITSLTDYLVLVHNSFVHAYGDRVNGSHIDKIPLRELEPSHMIEYHEQIHSLLLSHAHYSLALGQGSYVTYDFEGVEKQFMDQFIQSKPLIVAEHIRFEYTREARSDMFEQVRHRVKQTEVKEVLWRAILEELDSLEIVSDVLRVLDVVIGILSSAGGDPEQKLSAYLDVLKYSSTPHGAGPLQSRRAEGVLCLKHILSFWILLSIERARHLSILGQIPFSSLSDEYQDILSDEEKKQIERTCDRNAFSKEQILTYLHQFIVFFLGEKGSDEKGYGLKDSITIYAEENGTKLAGVFSDLPEGITLSQTAAVWALLARRDRISD